MAWSSPICALLHKAYRLRSRRVRAAIRRLIARLEGGEPYSATLRRVFRDYHDVDVGRYTHGGCFVPFNFGRFTTIGRYCSIAMTARAFTRNHPMEWKSTHAIFFNPLFGYCREDRIEYSPLRIGNDVWLGEGSIVMPNVGQIGDGAVIGAGAVVNKDVPPYAVVVGNPGRVVRYRFSEPTIRELLASRWWEQEIDALAREIADFQGPYEPVPPQGGAVPTVDAAPTQAPTIT